MIKITKVTVTTEFVDDTTGEIFKDTREYKDESVKTTKKSSTKASTSVIDDDVEPKLLLQENKYILNNAAIEALGIDEGDTVDIKNQKVGNSRVKVIGSSDTFGTKGGNKLTKSHSISCRGKSNDELSILGDIFTLTPHPNVAGLFILTGNKQPNPVDEGPEEEDNTNIEDELQIDEDVVEISEDDFNFALNG